MLTNKNVRIKKLSPSKNPRYPTPEMANYKVGQFLGNEGLSIPVDYEIEGVLMADIVIGCSVIVYRTKRNGVECDGLFHTSKVVFLNENGFETENSIYQLEII